MLNELIDIFVGMYRYILEELGMLDYEYQAYFISNMCVIVTAAMIIGTFILICVIVSETFKTIRGSTK